jgi:hypothetical protein
MLPMMMAVGAIDPRFKSVHPSPVTKAPDPRAENAMTANVLALMMAWALSRSAAL